jgi:hypothetical protein
VIEHCVPAASREDDGGAIVSAQLLRESDARTRNFEIDVYERDFRPALPCERQRLGRAVRGSENHVSRILQRRCTTVGNNRFILDDQYHHHITRSHPGPVLL